MTSDDAKKPADAIHIQAVEVLDIDGGSKDFRPVHTVGIGVTGYFVPSDVAKNYCTAKFFQDPQQQTPVTARFSNGKGLVKAHDSWNDTRGLAVRFDLDNGSKADLLAMTLSEFFTPTPKSFLKFGKATNPRYDKPHPTPPAPAKRDSAWRKLLDMLQLIQPLPDPPPGLMDDADARATKFADHNDYARLPMFHGAMLGAPESYRRAVYHAVHTFVVVAPDNSRRHVRFSWIPVAGVKNRDPRKDPPCDKYLNEELKTYFQPTQTNPPARFILMMVIGEAGDNLNDPSRPWPPHRVRVVMGTLSIDKIPEDQDEHCERLSFNPWRLVPGIEPSDDPILRLRRDAYEWSRNRRHAECPYLRK